MQNSRVAGVVGMAGDMHNSRVADAVRAAGMAGKTEQLDEKLMRGGESGAIDSNSSEVEVSGSAGSGGRLGNEKDRSKVDHPLIGMAAMGCGGEPDHCGNRMERSQCGENNSGEPSQSSTSRFSKFSNQLRFSDIRNLRASPSSSELLPTSYCSELLIDMDASSADLSDSSWIDSNDSSDDIQNYSADNDLPKKHTHFGADLSGFSDDNDIYRGLVLDFSEETALKTASVGTRKAFIIGNNNSLNVVTLQRRFIFDYEGPITFIELSQLY